MHLSLLFLFLPENKKRTTLRSTKLLLNSGEEFGDYYKYGKLLGQGTHSVVVKV